MFVYIRRRLGAKLFLAFLVIIIVGVMVLAASAEFAIPSAFDRHMSNMIGSDSIMGMNMMSDMGTDFHQFFQRASRSPRPGIPGGLHCRRYSQRFD